MSAGISITPDDVLKARGSNFLDEMDTVYSPKDGRICVVAKHQGAYVCWGCGDQFVQGHPDLGETEKTSLGGTVPIILHIKCADRSHRPFSFASVMEASKGLSLRRAVAKAIKPFLAK